MNTPPAPACPARTERAMSEFFWPVRVYYEDTDVGGIVYYANYLRFMERARTEWLRALGVEQDRLRRDTGRVFVVRSAQLDFHRPARLDDALQVGVRLLECRRASLRLEQRVLRGAGAVELCCAAQVRPACVDAASLRPRAIPQALRSRIADDHN